MPELATFVHSGTARITPHVVKGVQKKLPFLKVEFIQINAPSFPHLVDQLEFLANMVEDFIDGQEEEIPYVTFASAIFALLYARRQLDLIPDSIQDFGHSDDSGVVRTVLIEHEKVLQQYARRHNINWAAVTVNP